LVQVGLLPCDKFGSLFWLSQLRSEATAAALTAATLTPAAAAPTAASTPTVSGVSGDRTLETCIRKALASAVEAVQTMRTWPGGERYEGISGELGHVLSAAAGLPSLCDLAHAWRLVHSVTDFPAAKIAAIEVRNLFVCTALLPEGHILRCVVWDYEGEP